MSSIFLTLNVWDGMKKENFNSSYKLHLFKKIVLPFSIKLCRWFVMASVRVIVISFHPLEKNYRKKSGNHQSIINLLILISKILVDYIFSHMWELMFRGIEISTVRIFSPCQVCLEWIDFSLHVWDSFYQFLFIWCGSWFHSKCRVLNTPKESILLRIQSTFFTPRMELFQLLPQWSKFWLQKLESFCHRFATRFLE